MNLTLTKEQLSKRLVFIHTPKCGGSYCATILKELNIQNNGHIQAIKNENIHFTIIRDPVQRFESLVNYRLGLNRIPIKYNDNSTLNEIVANMTDAQILGFNPYKTLCYWTKNVDIIITIDQLPKLLKLFGYTYESRAPINVSSKLRGTFNTTTRNRIKKLFENDCILFNNYEIFNI
jgi:hypothetical protein